MTPIHHPNVRADGGIALDVLFFDQWSPAITVPKVLKEIYEMLTTPDTDESQIICREWTRDPENDQRIAREHAVKFSVVDCNNEAPRPQTQSESGSESAALIQSSSGAPLHRLLLFLFPVHFYLPV